ncbi:MAG: metallophosphoesterase family protein, partial [Clostridiales bacterium]|nr:metallophosphoesterase family protein [Clostridiales bacterium]
MPHIVSETVLTVGNTDFFITHGNAYGVKSSTLSFAAHAREIGCAWALYGHTHRAQIVDAGGVMLLNPGTASGGSPTCARITGDGETFFGEIVSL